jgi:hypothetical protein
MNRLSNNVGSVISHNPIDLHSLHKRWMEVNTLAPFHVSPRLLSSPPPRTYYLRRVSDITGFWRARTTGYGMYMSKLKSERRCSVHWGISVCKFDGDQLQPSCSADKLITHTHSTPSLMTHSFSGTSLSWWLWQQQSWCCVLSARLAT